MSSFYSVIKYVPDPIADECINIGVVVCDKDKSLFKFINNWKRVQAFGKEDPKFLREFIDEISNKRFDLFSNKSFTKAELQKHFGGWINSIQFTDFHASTKKSEELLVDVANIFLHAGVSKVTEPTIGRNTVLANTSKVIKAILEKRYGKKATTYLKRKIDLEGKISNHSYDLVLKNGRPYFGVITLSFCVVKVDALLKEVELAAWAIEDVRRKTQNIRLSLVAQLTSNNKAFEHAARIMKKLNTPIITQEKLSKWATELVEELPKDFDRELAKNSSS